MKYMLMFLLALPLGLSAQDVAFSFNSGVATSAMKDFKSHQQEVASSFPVGFRVTSSFPANWYYEGSVAFTFENGIVTGVNLSYTSTGGGLFYSDNSSTMRFDQKLSARSISGGIGKEFRLRNKSWLVRGYLYQGTTLTRVTEFSKTEAGVQVDDHFYSARSFNIYVQPSMRVTKRFWYFGATAEVGYYQTVIFGKLRTGTTADSWGNQPGGDVHADWSGIRLSAGLSVYFSRFKTTP